MGENWIISRPPNSFNARLLFLLAPFCPNFQLELAGPAAALALGHSLPSPPAVAGIGAEGGGWAEEGPRMADLKEPVQAALKLGLGIFPAGGGSGPAE